MKLLNRKQQGMTITELMVAVAIGLIVSAAVAGLFLQTTASNNQNDEITYLQENGRYALKIIADDLEMSNFWAGLAASNRTGIGLEDAAVGSGTIDTGNINGDENTLCNNGATTTNPGENWNYLTDQPLQVITNATETAALAAFPCIDNADNSLDFVADRSVLMIKRTKGQEESSGQTPGRPYVRGNRTVATFHKYTADTDPPPSGFRDWQYLNHIYYIAQDSSCNPCVPKLVRQALREKPGTPSAAPTYVTEEIAEGIEHFHIMWGIDTTGNAVVDTFTSTPTNAQLLNAIVAKIYVLARGKSEVLGYSNDKKYVLGDREITPGDGFYRRVFSTTVVMKNTEAIIQMAAM